MNLLRFFLVVSVALLLGPHLAGQTPGEEIAQLKARVKELETENQKLREAVAKNGTGTLGESLGQLVTIEGVGDNTRLQNRAGVVHLKVVFSYLDLGNLEPRKSKPIEPPPNR